MGPKQNSPGQMSVATCRFDAFVFDMDGVVTDTAMMHAAAWKTLFDEYLQRHSSPGEEAVRFSEDDYRRYVDGRMRVDGVVAFLASRHIELPLGDADDPPDEESAWGLANRKNELLLDAFDDGEIRVFPSTVALLHRLRALGLRTALVTASRNAADVLAAAGVSQLFDARVDGIEVERLGLAGKPDPAQFLEAARRLGVDPARSVVIEDSLAGVAAARRGGFGLVVGVDRAGHAAALAEHGADVVVGDLAEIVLDEQNAYGDAYDA